MNFVATPKRNQANVSFKYSKPNVCICSNLTLITSTWTHSELIPPLFTRIFLHKIFKFLSISLNDFFIDFLLLRLVSWRVKNWHIWCDLDYDSAAPRGISNRFAQIYVTGSAYSDRLFIQQNAKRDIRSGKAETGFRWQIQSALMTFLPIHEHTSRYLVWISRYNKLWSGFTSQNLVT